MRSTTFLVASLSGVVTSGNLQLTPPTEHMVLTGLEVLSVSSSYVEASSSVLSLGALLLPY